MNKRKSNWYVYATAFIVTAALLTATIWALRDKIFGETALSASVKSGSDYRPDKDLNLTTLLALSKEKGGDPVRYALLNYRPRDEKAIFVPIRTDAIFGDKTLADIYSSSGLTGIVKAIEKNADIVCKEYVKFDYVSFSDFADSVGKTTINVPADIFGEDGAELFRAGTRSLDGEELFNYLVYNSAELDYSLVSVGSAVCSFLNDNAKNLNAAVLQSVFSKIINETDSSYDFDDFVKYQAAYIYTSSNSPNFAEYYIPYGDTSDFGFSLSPASLQTIKDEFAIFE